MTWAVNKMRKPDVNEGFVSRYLIRPVSWLAYQLSSEARMIRRHRSQR